MLGVELQAPGPFKVLRISGCLLVLNRVGGGESYERAEFSAHYNKDQTETGGSFYQASNGFP